MLLRVSAGAVPPGTYFAKLLAVEPVTSDQYGNGIRFSFQVAKGQYAGQKVSRTTGCTASPKSSLGKLLSGMLGRALNLDEEVEVNGLLGREYLIVVGVTEGGGSRVETATPPPID
jgi:hypothetical protein